MSPQQESADQPCSGSASLAGPTCFTGSGYDVRVVGGTAACTFALRTTCSPGRGLMRSPSAPPVSCVRPSGL